KIDHAVIVQGRMFDIRHIGRFAKPDVFRLGPKFFGDRPQFTGSLGQRGQRFGKRLGVRYRPAIEAGETFAEARKLLLRGTSRRPVKDRIAKSDHWFALSECDTFGAKNLQTRYRWQHGD